MWGTVLLEKPTAAQLNKKLPALDETKIFITMRYEVLTEVTMKNTVLKHDRVQPGRNLMILLPARCRQHTPLKH
jgi:hypothetical protein